MWFSYIIVDNKGEMYPSDGVSTPNASKCFYSIGSWRLYNSNCSCLIVSGYVHIMNTLPEIQHKQTLSLYSHIILHATAGSVQPFIKITVWHSVQRKIQQAVRSNSGWSAPLPFRWFCQMKTNERYTSFTLHCTAIFIPYKNCAECIEFIKYWYPLNYSSLLFMYLLDI